MRNTESQALISITYARNNRENGTTPLFNLGVAVAQTPFAHARPRNPAEEDGEVAVAREAAALRDLTDGQCRAFEQFLDAPDALSLRHSENCGAKSRPETRLKVASGATCRRHYVRDIDFCVRAVPDVGDGAQYGARSLDESADGFNLWTEADGRQHADIPFRPASSPIVLAPGETLSAPRPMGAILVLEP